MPIEGPRSDKESTTEVVSRIIAVSDVKGSPYESPYRKVELPAELAKAFDEAKTAEQVGAVLLGEDGKLRPGVRLVGTTAASQPKAAASAPKPIGPERISLTSRVTLGQKHNWGKTSQLTKAGTTIYSYIGYGGTAPDGFQYATIQPYAKYPVTVYRTLEDARNESNGFSTKV